MPSSVDLHLKDTPGVGTFYDFFDRLYLMEKSASKAKGKTRFKRKPKKNKKTKDEMPTETSPEHNHQGVIQRLVDRMIKEDIRQRATGSFHRKPDYLLQRIFKECFVLPSAKLGIIDLENLSIAGDGTKLSTFASHYGKKICSCKDSCNHSRRFSDRDAKWGWDSFHEVWVYGYGIHELVDLESGLPIILPQLTGANMHDGVAAISLIQKVWEQGYRIGHSVFDSAYDNYHFYLTLIDYCQISPIICLNKRCQGISSNKALIFFTPEGIPMCLYGLALTNWGFCSGHKIATSGAVQYVLLFSTKMRVVPIEISVREKGQITVRVLYTYPKENHRLLTPVPRESELRNELYRKRGTCERSFKTKKIDYKLDITRTTGKKMWFIRVALAGMCQHIDAQAQMFLSFTEEKNL